MKPMVPFILTSGLISARTLRVLIVLLLAVVPGCAPAQETEQTSPWMTGSWHTLQTADTPMPRHEHAYVEVDGLFYLIGGRGDRPVQVFDPVAQTWTTRGLPPLEMHHFQAVSYNGLIYIIGAFTGGFPTETPIPHIYIYDPATDQWKQGPEIPAHRQRGSAGVVVHHNTFYLVSGIQNGHSDGHVTWFDAFDPTTGAWTALPDAPRARDHFQVAVIDGKLYAAGGRRSSHATGQVFQLTEPAVDVYDFATGAWSTLPPAENLPTERAGTTTVVYHGKLVVIGGESDQPPPAEGARPPAHDEVEAYDPESEAWVSLPPLNQGRHATQAIVFDDNIYLVAGSRTMGGTEINSQEVYALAN